MSAMHRMECSLCVLHDGDHKTTIKEWRKVRSKIWSLTLGPVSIHQRCYVMSESISSKARGIIALTSVTSNTCCSPQDGSPRRNSTSMQFKIKMPCVCGKTLKFGM